MQWQDHCGDFNAISLEDHRFVDTKNLVNAWIAFQTLMTSIMELSGCQPRYGSAGQIGLDRLDKVEKLGSKAKEMQVLHPGTIELS